LSIEPYSLLIFMTLEPCVNLRTLGSHITGVQRYLLSLLPHLPPELRSVKPARALQGIKGHLWEQFYLPTQLKRRLLWSPGNTGPLGVSRQVLTVHDAAALDHPEWFERKFALWYSALLPRLIRKVRAIITVSQFSKERIVRLTGVEADRIQVISNGVDGRFQPKDRKTIKEAVAHLGLIEPYILFVGSLEPRKNLKMLVETWQMRNFEGATLAVAGTTGRVFQRFQTDSTPKGVRLLGRVEDDLLPILYSGAAGFVYGSIYEGFGLPPLEAMAHGTPVVTSNATSLPEVVGNAAVLVNPENVFEIMRALHRVLMDQPLRERMKERGYKQVTRFSWESSVRRVLDAYRQVASDGNPQTSSHAAD
jgi:glycosyltransferase involved in cell wall biosynthesis